MNLFCFYSLQNSQFHFSINFPLWIIKFLLNFLQLALSVKIHSISINLLFFSFYLFLLWWFTRSIFQFRHRWRSQYARELRWKFDFSLENLSRLRSIFSPTTEHRFSFVSFPAILPFPLSSIGLSFSQTRGNSLSQPSRDVVRGPGIDLCIFLEIDLPSLLNIFHWSLSTLWLIYLAFILHRSIASRVQLEKFKTSERSKMEKWTTFFSRISRETVYATRNSRFVLLESFRQFNVYSFVL